MSYIDKFQKIKKELEIDIEWHCFLRMIQRNVREDEVEKTFREGKINYKKCEEFKDKRYNKICTYRYFGKSKRTIEIIILFYEKYNFGEVRTVWIHKGKKN